MDISKKGQASNQMLVAIVAVSVSLFHLLNVSGLIALSTMPIRIIHLCAMMMIVFLTKGARKKSKGVLADRIFQYLLFAGTLACSLYLLVRWEDIANSGGVTNQTDIIVGSIMMLLVLESTRRSVGVVLAIISTVFLVYPFIGSSLPGLLQTRSYSLTRIIKMLFTTSDGIYGIPISVSSNYIILFCIYGAFLSEFGAGQFLFELSSSLTRRFSAASAKTSIIFSALLGMLSGSAAGNVAITGSLTIPMMEKEHYTKEQAGAISAVAATGGQIMPPIMGAAAFIMASIIGIPYASIMKAAIIPSILYFLSIFMIVHLIAKKANITDRYEATNKSFLTILREGWPLALPIVSLIVMMVLGNSPFKAAFFSIISLLVVYVPNRLLRKQSFSLKDFGKRIVASLRKGAMDTVGIATACAAAGIISGILSVTGLSSKLALLIVGASHGYLIVALVLTMFISLILGMGLPTTAAYLVLATVVAPALMKMGASVLASHLFVFYFGCISTITPPVALASYVAAGIAKADLNKVGTTAFKYGIVSFILPFMFVYGDNLLMEGSAFGVLSSFVFAVIGVMAIAMAIVGYANGPIKSLLRGMLILSGVLMIFEGVVTDLGGLAVFIIVMLVSSIQRKKEYKHANV
jgi:TRAP transporter 4TM/12TM fusion protein